MAPLIGTAFALFMGLMATRLFKLLKLNFPDVTAFLLAGLLVGPYFLGALDLPWFGFRDFDQIEALSPVTSVALGFIAFSIGAEFRLSEIKEIGRAAVVIGILQAVTAAVLVDAALIGLHFVLGDSVLPLPACITLGAIASATAPAATLMVVRQYKAKGPVTSLLLPIVALDDAVGLVLFAVSFGIAQALEGGTLSVISIVLDPLLEIVCSLVLGAVMGLLLSVLEKLFFSNSNRLAMTISIVFMTIAFSSVSFKAGPVTIAFSSLLTCMMAGTVFCNASEYSKDIFERCDKWTVPLYACFFVLSGAELDLAVFRYPSMVLVGITYILVRCLGKYSGAKFSSSAMHCDENVRKYLGITLFPQAGVALGMVVTAQTLGSPSGEIIRNVILFSVLIYELVGPSMTRWALTKAGDISSKPASKTSRERFQKA